MVAPSSSSENSKAISSEITAAKYRPPEIKANHPKTAGRIKILPREKYQDTFIMTDTPTPLLSVFTLNFGS